MADIPVARRWYPAAGRRQVKALVEALGPKADDALLVFYFDAEFQQLGVEIDERRINSAWTTPFSKLISRGYQLKATRYLPIINRPRGESPSLDDLLIFRGFQRFFRDSEMRLVNFLFIAGDDVWMIFDGPF